jgi:hypothetical protein
VAPAFADRILRARRRAAARRVYEEMLRGLAWARDPAGTPLEDAAWTAFRARFAVGRALHEAVDWAYDTLRDAGPARPPTAREAAVLAGLARRHPQLFRAVGPPPEAPAPRDRDVWGWIGAAVPEGLWAIGAEAGIDAGRVNRDLATAIVGA